MSDLLNRWKEFKVLVESLDLDIHKNGSGNKSAGVRARKGLRQAKKHAAELVKASLAADKAD
jgi:hypothetical protein